MAQRFGGKYSPPARTDETVAGYPGVAPERLPEAGPRHPMVNRPSWLPVAAFPFLFNAFGDGPTALARGLGAFALVVLAAWLLREGLKAEAAFAARKVARRPALPRKALGAALVGLALGLGAQAPEMGLWGAGLVGAIGAGLCLLAFGLDPLRDKGTEGIDPFQQDRVAKVVAEGERHLEAIRTTISALEDARLAARIEGFATTARSLFRAIENDPSDLSAARRYMTVYLQGTRDASVKFADLWAHHHDTQARQDYEALLDDLEAQFAAHQQRLHAAGREGLDIEIEVLRERLAREGVAPPRDGARDGE